MSKTIHKYPLIIFGSQRVMMPAGAKILTVQLQDGVPCLWALVDTDFKSKERAILMRGTGYDVSDVGKYIDTFQMPVNDGVRVVHVFEGGEEP